MTKSSSPISRLGAASDASGDPILVDMYSRIRAHRGYVLNIHQVAGFAPKLLRAQATYAASMRDENSLPRDFQELLIIRIAQVNDSNYEQTVHRPIAVRCGLDPRKIDALPTWQKSDLYNERERAALAYVDQASRSGEVDDATFAAARKIFSDQEMVEITVLVAWYVGNARFVRALRIANQPEQT